MQSCPLGPAVAPALLSGPSSHPLPRYQPVYREAKVWLFGLSEMAADHFYTFDVCPCPQCVFLRRCWVRVFPTKQKSLWLPWKGFAWLNSAPLCQHRSVLPGLKPLKVSNPLCLALLVVLFITSPPLDSCQFLLRIGVCFWIPLATRGSQQVLASGLALYPSFVECFPLSFSPGALEVSWYGGGAGIDPL